VGCRRAVNLGEREGNLEETNTKPMQKTEEAEK